MNAEIVQEQARRTDQVLMRAIRRGYEENGVGPTLTDLYRMTGTLGSTMQASLRRLFAVGLIIAGANGRYHPAFANTAPAPTTKLTPEELERVRRGEPSTGRPPTASALPSTVLATPVAPPPRVTIDLSKKRRSRLSDEDILLAYRSHRTRAAAAQALGISKTGMSHRLKLLGVAPGRPGFAPRISDDQIRRVMAKHAQPCEAAQHLGISLVTLWQRRRKLGLSQARMGRPRLVSDEKLKAVVLAHETLKAAADELGVSLTTVWKWSHRLGVRPGKSSRQNEGGDASHDQAVIADASGQSGTEAVPV